MSKQWNDYKRILGAMETTGYDLIVRVGLPILVLSFGTKLSMRDFPLSQYVGKLAIYSGLALALMSAIVIIADFKQAKMRIQDFNNYDK